MSGEIRRERLDDGLFLITIDRPQARNALDVELTERLVEAFRSFDEDPSARVAVLTGSGGGFSAGMDLKAFLRGDPMWDGAREGFGMKDLLAAPPTKPMIAAIEGFALAGGLELALCCDLLVASRSATFGVPEATRGLIPGGGALMRLPRRVGLGLANRMVLTGEPVAAADALRSGLVDELCDDGRALEAAVALGRTIAGNGALAVSVAKEIIRRQSDWTDEEFWSRQEPLRLRVLGSADAEEGARAFAERRDPVWSRAEAGSDSRA